MATRVIGLDIGTRYVRGVILESRARSIALAELVEEPIATLDTELLSPLNGEVDAHPSAESSEAPQHDANEQLEGGDGGEEAVEAAPARAWSPEVEAAVRRILERPGLEVDTIIAAAPEGVFMMTAIELPFHADREVRAVLGPQLDGRIPGEVEELHLDYMVSGKNDEGLWRVFAGGLPQEEMALMMNEWEGLEVDPRVIDVMPFPLFTAGEWLQPSKERSVAYIDMGASYTRIIIAHNGLVEVARTIPGGGDAVTAAIARQYELSLEHAHELKHSEASVSDELASPEAQRLADAVREGLRPTVRDLRRTLTAHSAAHGRAVEQIYVSGGAFNLKGLASLIEQELYVPAEALSFNRDEVNTIPGAKAVSHSFMTALGLALRGFPPPTTSAFNLRHGAWAFRGAYEYITRRLPALAMMVGLLLFALLFYTASRNSLLKAEFRAADDGLAEISRQVFGTEVRDPALVQSRLARGVEGSGLHPNISAYDVIVRLSKAAQVTVDAQMPIELTNLDVDMSRRQVRVSGVCDSANAAETFGQNLGNDSCMKSVQRTNLNQRRSDSKFEFSYTATVNCSAPPPTPVEPVAAEIEADDASENEEEAP